MSYAPLACTPKSLPNELAVPAAQHAIQVNAQNSPAHMLMLPSMPRPTPFDLAVVTSKYWHNGGVNLTVGFLDNPPLELRSKILQHMNAWSKTAVVSFRETADMRQAQVRISRAPGGYWSYIGTDILLVNDPNAQTMNLEGFTLQTPDAEFFRVVRHETGHTIGCPHEHMRAELVALIDPAKAISYYGQTQGWTPDQVRNQVLTPYSPAELIGTAHTDQNSIMCYQIPGALTKDGKPILGGNDIDATDYTFIATVYPKPATPAPRPAPTASPAANGHTAAASTPSQTPGTASAAAETEDSSHHAANGHERTGHATTLPHLAASAEDKDAHTGEDAAPISPGHLVRATLRGGVELSFSADLPERVIQKLLNAVERAN